MTTHGPCQHHTDATTCSRTGVVVALPCPAGRPDAVGGPYCEKHGGRERAELEAGSSWNYLAPACVGDEEAVQAAGEMSLDSRDAYIVIRNQPAGKGRPEPRWLAWLGIGDFTEAVAVPGSQIVLAPGDPVPDVAPHRKRGEKRDEYRARIATRGSFGFHTCGDAREAAIAAWRARLHERVEAIRSARGGTLEWGVPIRPLDRPIILENPGILILDRVDR